MANFEIKTIKEIYDDIIAKYTALRIKYGDTSPLLEKAAVKSIAWAFAGTLGILWQLSVWIYKQCFPQTADLPALKFWGGLIGVQYKTGTFANILIKLTDVTAASLSTGTVYKDLNTGLIYKTISQATAYENIIFATAQCTTSGPVGNIPVDTILTIANPVDGIPSTAVVTAVSIEGTEDEATEDYRKRVLFGYRNKTRCGAPLDYFIWATEVSGIVDALIYVLESGMIALYLVAAGSSDNRSPSGSLSTNPFPLWVDGQFTEFEGEGQLLAVANSIEGSEPGVHDRRPATAHVNLLAPVYTGFKMEITGLSDTSYSSAIKDSLISILDEKRPNIVVLGYGAGNAKINRLQLSAACTDVVGSETFTSFILKDEDNNSIDEVILGVGCLAYLSELKINGEII